MPGRFSWTTWIRRALGGLAAAAAGVYGAEVAFRTLFLVPSVPETGRQFERAVSAGWPRPVAPRKREGTLRILGLADSFGVSGGGRNYHFLLEEGLRARGSAVEVVNFSVSGYSPAEQWLLLDRFAAGYAPDVVLHGFFVGNDFGVPTRETMRFAGIDVGLAPGAAGWLPGNLTLVRWLERWSEGVADRRARSAARARGEPAGSFSRERFLRIERVRLGACRRQAGDGPAWPVTTRILDAIGEKVRRLGAAHVMVAHPDQLQVEPALAREVIAVHGLDPGDYEIDLPQQYLRAYAGSRGLPLVDLLPAFREKGSEGGLYLLDDSHYSERGHELAAARIAEAIEPVLAACQARATRAAPAGALEVSRLAR